MHQVPGTALHLCGVAAALEGVNAVTYEPIIRHVPIIVPIILAAGIVAVTVYRPPQIASAPGVAWHDAAVGDPAGLRAHSRLVIPGLDREA